MWIPNLLFSFFLHKYAYDKLAHLQRIHLPSSRAVLAGKISRGHGPGDKGEERGSGGFAHSKFFDHALFALRNRSSIAQRFATYTRKSCKNEKAKMKESKQNDREIEYRTTT